MLAHAPEGGLVVGLANRFRLEVVVLEETTGTLSGGAWTAGLRDGCGRLVGKGGGDHQEPGDAAIVAQFGMAEFGDGPIRELSGWRTKRGCICGVPRCFQWDGK